MIKPTYGYITKFGRDGSAGKAIFMGLEIANLSYEKEVWIATTPNNWQKAQYGSGPHSSGPLISHLTTRGNVDYFETLDYRTDSRNAVKMDISIKMNGQVYNCPGVTIGFRK